jgi:hypothetical protein
MYMNTVQGDYEMQMKIGDIVRTIVIKPEKVHFYLIVKFLHK